MTAEVLRLLQASSCFRGEVCSSLPCACAETLARLGARAQCAPDRQAAAKLIRASIQKKYGTAAVQASADGMDRVYYAGIPLLDLIDAVLFSLTSADGNTP